MLSDALLPSHFIDGKRRHEEIRYLFNDQTASEGQCQKLNLSGLATEAGPLSAMLSSPSHKSIHLVNPEKTRRGICGKRPDLLLGNKVGAGITVSQSAFLFWND